MLIRAPIVVGDVRPAVGVWRLAHRLLPAVVTIMISAYSASAVSGFFVAGL